LGNICRIGFTIRLSASGPDSTVVSVKQANWLHWKELVSVTCYLNYFASQTQVKDMLISYDG